MMKSRLFAHYGRLAFRAVVTGGVLIDVAHTECRPSVSTNRFYAAVSSNSVNEHDHKVHTSCCGFPKNLIGGASMVLDQGVIGEDACFIARINNTYVVGVADGVGGWRKYGIDPSEFSSRLMNICSDIVRKGEFEPMRPDLLLAKAFETLALPPRPVGSSTACVLIVHRGMLHSANLGDSGYLVLRKGEIVYKSREQTHYFNAPFQLSLPPENSPFSGFIGDSPDMAELHSISLKSGDIIVLATDGLWDNVSENLIVEQLKDIQPGDLQSACNSLALSARRLAFDTRHTSPFAVKASKHGIDAPGGKPDDITLVLLLIA
ncbi:unnamed protein product [Dracunculus medinensis]|uniref:Protein phosphatase n=1 Tax=Dracunculus medinensis TaxID=318479 RepID=A0A0N4UGP9_DRAME|nr:unnamed protein product [Dracunculus medinensis]